MPKKIKAPKVGEKFRWKGGDGYVKKNEIIVVKEIINYDSFNDRYEVRFKCKAGYIPFEYNATIAKEQIKRVRSKKK